jgi:hypothetical protein
MTAVGTEIMKNTGRPVHILPFSIFGIPDNCQSRLKDICVFVAFPQASGDGPFSPILAFLFEPVINRVEMTMLNRASFRATISF